MPPATFLHPTAHDLWLRTATCVSFFLLSGGLTAEPPPSNKPLSSERRDSVNAASGQTNPSPTVNTGVSDNGRTTPGALVGDDATLAATLHERVEALRQSPRLDEAVAVARQLVGLRREKQGDDWFETQDAVRLVAELEHARSLKPADQTALLDAYRLIRKADEQATPEHIAAAITSRRRALALFRQLLGAESASVAETLADLAEDHGEPRDTSTASRRTVKHSRAPAPHSAIRIQR